MSNQPATQAGRGPSEADIAQMSKMYGGYLGDVICRERGGEWFLEKSGACRKKTVCLRQGCSVLFPPARVYQRLRKGNEANVRHYYDSLTGEVHD